MVTENPKDNIGTQAPTAVKSAEGQAVNANASQGGTTQPNSAASSKPAWLLDKFKSPEDQAKAYAEAEKKMVESTTKAAQLEQEVSRLRDEIFGASQQRQPTGYASAVPEVQPDIKAQIEQRYGGVVPAEQVQAMMDVVNYALSAQIKPVTETIYNNQLEMQKSKIREKDKLFERFEPEIDMEIKRFPVEQRTNPRVIEACKASVVNRHLPELQNEWIELGRKESINPSVPYAGETNGVATTPHETPNIGNIKLTEEQKMYAARYGGNPEETEKFVNTLYGGK